MGSFLRIIVYCCLCAGVRCVHLIPWLPCHFIDEHVFQTNYTETELIHREVLLQFGQKGDSPLNPHGVTFLITGSKLDMRKYLDGVEANQLECDLRRYSTEGIHVRWPALGAHGYNYWFSCTIKHSEGRFAVTTFLRQPTDQPPPDQQDYHSWPEIKDGHVLTTTVATVIRTNSPSVKASLGSQQKLNCQIDIDHKGANFTAEWKWQHRGERKDLFSYSSRSGIAKGGGVGIKALTGGDASYTLPFIKMSSEGTFICSVFVMPIFASVEVNLRIEESPRVSINVGSTLSLHEGERQKVVCTADHYYPLDVDIVWYQQDPATVGQRVGAPLPKVLQHVLLSSHKHNTDMTYTLSAFFYLQASLRDSGSQFTCSVSHQSLRVPIKKSFILTVEDPFSWMFVLSVGFVLLTLSFVLLVMLRSLHTARRRSTEKKPY